MGKQVKLDDEHELVILDDGSMTQRYWVSWYSGNYADEGCTKPPFQFWLSGWRYRANAERTNLTLCAVIDAETENQVLDALHRYFPDCELRFMEPREADFVPGDRFPGFENRTGLKWTKEMEEHG